MAKKVETVKKLAPTSINVSKASKVYLNTINSVNKNPEFVALKQVLSDGENYIRQTQRTEVKKFDEKIIQELEEGLNAIEKILANPRTFIKEQAELVQVGLAKKVSSLSIRHFATHSQFVQSIDENGEVIPEKVLTIYSEVETAIYENRFIMTLIRRCLAFIQKRYQFILEHGETRDSDLLLIHNKTVIDNVTYEVDSRIKVSVPSAEDGNESSNAYILNKLKELKTRNETYFISPFMTQMKGAREVTSPIHMTNMIVKHPDYHRAYEFWCFLEEYEELGISYDITETNQKFSKEYLDEINTYIANSVAALHSNKVNDGELTVDVEGNYTPQVIFTLEDETYMDSRFLYDAYPEALKTDKLHLPMSAEEVRNQLERFHQRLKNQKDARVNVHKAILKDKDENEYHDAELRKKRIEEVKKDIDLLVNEIKRLRGENDRLELEIEKLTGKKARKSKKSSKE